MLLPLTLLKIKSRANTLSIAETIYSIYAFSPICLHFGQQLVLGLIYLELELLGEERKVSVSKQGVQVSVE